MPDKENDPENAYESVLAQSPKRSIDINTKTNAPALRSAFNKASKRQEQGPVLGTDLISANEPTYAVLKDGTLGKHPDPEDLASLRAWGVNTDDSHQKMPPGSKEFGDLLTAIHDAEHARRQNDSIAPSELTGEAQSQAREIDADNAVMKFLDDSHDPAAKNYWLQNREVTSFTNGLAANNLINDTATFLRVYEKTGKQLDLDAFAAEKRGLFDRLHQKLDVQTNVPPKVDDAMGAMVDLLIEDNRQTDPSKKLSAVQRAEAESFLRDGQAMGYVPSESYPKSQAHQPQGAEQKFNPVLPPTASPKA